jgi:ferredoxin-NADP reductase
MDKSKLKLLEVRQEAGDVKTFVFENGGLKWLAGQSQEYVLSQAGATMDENSRRFTISSAPSEGTINITTRITQSAYKQALNALTPGEEIERYALEGDFTWEDEPLEPVVLVAGGIGITPFRSILLERDHMGKKLNATLLYFNRTKEAPLLKEFEALAQSHAEFKFQTIIGEPVTAKKILELAPESRRSLVYISGPEGMVQAVGNELKQEGVNIKTDEFPGYNDHNY